MLLIGIVGANLLAFGLFAVDKRAAIHGDSRIPENTLLLVSLLGGSPAAFAAQQLFHHKTRKQPFLTRFWMVVAFQGVVAGGWILLGLPLPTPA
ncbi:MAG: DUF1294 domain-containing protein [Caulobacter sp.]|nr:DUF1294 domain-containing protein [Caulobacter sp.]